MFVKIPDYENEPPEQMNGNGDNGRPSVYWLVFAIIFCGHAGMNLASVNFSWMFSPSNIRVGAAAFLAAGGWTAALALVNYYIWPAFVVWFTAPKREVLQTAVNEPEPTPALRRPPATEPEEPRQVEQTVTPRATDVEEWVLIGNKPIYLSDHGVTLDDWTRLKSARQRGEMPTVSPNSLKEKMGLDDEAASNLNDLLLHLGLSRDGGHRQPNRFTALGERVLPTRPTEAARVH